MIKTTQSRQTKIVGGKENDNHNILQSKQRFIPSIKYATCAVEMQSYLLYLDPSLSLLPIHDGIIPTNTTTDNAMVCDN